MIYHHLRVSTRHTGTFREEIQGVRRKLNVLELCSFFYFCLVVHNLTSLPMSISRICLKGVFLLPLFQAHANCVIKYCSPPNQMMSSPNLKLTAWGARDRFQMLPSSGHTVTLFLIQLNEMPCKTTLKRHFEDSYAIHNVERVALLKHNRSIKLSQKHNITVNYYLILTWQYRLLKQFGRGGWCLNEGGSNSYHKS